MARQDPLKEAMIELVAVVKQLRDPDQGCPWDLQQTHASLLPYALEEAHELADAIRHGDDHRLKEELGDLLLQVLLHSQIASEEQRFDCADVARGLHDKLVRRHPHVFPTPDSQAAKANRGRSGDAEAVRRDWEAIKASEAQSGTGPEGKGTPRVNASPLSAALSRKVRGQPPLTAAMAISRKAAGAGFEWDSLEGVWEKLEEELAELRQAVASGDRPHAETELGEVLFTLVNVARWCDLSPEEGLASMNQRFLDCFSRVEGALAGDLQGRSIQDLEGLWQQATRQKRSQIAPPDHERSPGFAGTRPSKADWKSLSYPYSSSSPGVGWIDEVHDGVRYGLAGRVVLEENSPYQRITLIESERYGKGLLLDGRWMTAERQERHYHEAIAHPALCGAASIERVLVIGGGDGGTARECLLHKEVRHLDLVEIDGRVAALCREHLANIGGRAWSDPRLVLQVADGIAWVAQASDASYDVVIVDGSDPSGPAEGLFNHGFLTHCRRLLRAGGVFATQSESPEAFPDVHLEMVRLLRELYRHADPMYGWVPMYPSGWWSWTFAACDRPRYRSPQAERATAVAEHCQIWSPHWQRGAFEMVPAAIERQLNRDTANSWHNPPGDFERAMSCHFDREGAVFIAARRDPKGCSTAIFGVPYDGTTSFRPGTRFGPAALREVSQGLETYCPQLDRDLENVAYVDLGALSIPCGAPEPVVAAVETVAGELLDAGLKPLMLGGEHSITSGAIAAAAQRHEDLVVVQLDAHADLRESWLGARHSHACAMRRCLDVLSAESLLQVGIRSGTKAEFAELHSSGRLVPAQPGDQPERIGQSLGRALEKYGSRPIYLTVDLDWFDPAVLPGAGTPEPGGFHWPHFAAVLETLRERRWVGADVVELAPQLDPTGQSAVLAAKVVRSLLLLMTSEGPSRVSFGG